MKNSNLIALLERTADNCTSSEERKSVIELAALLRKHSLEDLQQWSEAYQKGLLVQIPCHCKDCVDGRLDKEMSSPESGWLYACRNMPNIWRRADGYCWFGKPRKSNE